MTRKIALYLLKRILDIAETENEDISIDKTDSSRNAVFWWTASEKIQLSAVWQDLILLLEILEEKQVMHIYINLCYIKMSHGIITLGSFCTYIYFIAL